MNRQMGCVAVVLGLGASVALGEPSWWKVRNVVDRNRDPQDRSVALQGQAKHVTWQAYLEFEEKLAPLGGAGKTISKMVRNNWFPVVEKDHLVCQIGQLKTLAAPFYDRLKELNIAANVGSTQARRYPWAGSTEGDEAVAAIGQVKLCFSFDLDLDKDGLPDWWEARTFGTYGHSGDDDTDGDGLTNLHEFRNGTSAHLADSDRDGIRDGQDGRPNHFDRPKPVIRAGELEAGGTRLIPAEALFAAENKARAARGLEKFETMRRDEVRPSMKNQPPSKPDGKGESQGKNGEEKPKPPKNEPEVETEEWEEEKAI